jgi:hypothetical protein
VRAVAIVSKQLQQRFGFLHAKRSQSIFRAVAGLIHGGRLWLTGLGRDLPGSSSDKHRIKAADRLLGNSSLQAELPALYRAFAEFLLERIARPILFVDGTDISTKVCELRAALWFDGRALIVYSEAHSIGRDQNPDVHREFLRHLAKVLPAHCKPILVTDAGFHYPWFDEVLRAGWDFVGRIRNRTTILVDGKWQPNKTLHRRAHNQAQNLGELRFNQRHERTYRFVLSKKRRSKNRAARTLRGTISQDVADKRYTAAAREPWLLATSVNGENARTVVKMYAGRMQVEESFRDSKSHRIGWSLSSSRSRPERVAVLLFLAALATVIVHVAGVAAEKLNLQRQFQANTTRKHRVLSVFFLGWRVLQTDTELPAYEIHAALLELSRIGMGPLAHA